MSNKINQIALISIITALVSTTTHAATNNAMTTKQDHEQCYGIAKKEKNDCMTNKHSCAGYAEKNGDPNEWLFVPKGYCEKIVGGQLQPKDADKQKK